RVPLHRAPSLARKLNRLKTLEDSTTKRSLRHHLTMLDLILLGMGTTGSVGLYVLVGTVAKEMAGPAVLVSFSMAAVASLLGALCYAEFGVCVPGRGSAYLFTYVSMGELWAFLVGWNTILGYLIGGAAVARVWSSYVDAIFSHRIRSFTMAHVGIWQVPFLAQYPDFLAAGVILLASALVSYGVGVSSWLNRTFSAINLVVILFIIILGFVLARPHNWSTEEGGFAPFGFSGIIDGAATCFFAFQGFGAIAASSMEAQNPKRAVPMAIAISLGLAAGTNILVSAALTFMVPWRSLDPDLALTDAFNQRGYSWAGFIVAAGAICAMNTFLLRTVIFLPRMVHAMAADGLFFQVFTYMHPQTLVPIVGIMVFGVLMAFLALLLDFKALVQFMSISALLNHTIVATSIVILRIHKSPPSSSLGSVSPVGTEQASAPEPRQLRPALSPYPSFPGGYRPEAAVAWALGVLVASAITLDCMLVFGGSALHLPPWGHTLLLLLSSVMFLLSLQIRPQASSPSLPLSPQVPMVPLTPALSILLNVFLMLHLSYLNWLSLSIWLLIGLVVYFGYGIWHSKENQRQLPGLTATCGGLEETVPVPGCGGPPAWVHASLRHRPTHSSPGGAHPCAD
uniref:Cationic amino acid transporter C-terminal domain-containing protein n=1 Tax=Equus asinus TaxID=9793 RepID=A0A8C4LSJ1_EQUAS